ncbi:MAG: hypothetical protein ACI9UQ_000590 [Candidatus Krumholzibacteriia bacterium]|jgi:hypothetical protein
MIQPQRGSLNNVFSGPLVALFFACLFLEAPVLAGTGSAVSAPASIDTRSPEVLVVDPPENLFVLAGETFLMQWSATEDNPSATPGFNVAEVWIGNQLQDSYPFDSAASSHQWTWTAPDTTSALAHLVVNSSDTFGNTSVVAGSNFTILSSVTHVPEASRAAIFSLPAPNPFNPMTRLSFDLPQNGLATVTVHDARGYRVNTLLSGHQAAGPLTLQWDGRDKAGRRQAGGTYFFRLEFLLDGRNEQIVRKAVLLP